MKRLLTSEAKFLRLLFIGALLMLVLIGVGRAVTLTHWLTRPRVEATLHALRTSTSAKSGGGGFACNRTYAYEWAGASLVETVDSPCLVWLGPSAKPGDRAQVSVQSETGTQPVGASEVWGIGLYETLPFVFIGGYFSFRRRMLRRGGWYVTAT